MESIKTIDQKIEALRIKKKETIKRISQSFFKQANQIIGEEFSPELALTLLQETWSKAPPKQQEEWRQRAKKFPRSQSDKSSKKTA